MIHLFRDHWKKISRFGTQVLRTLGIILLSSPAFAFNQNPTVGSFWTWLGPTFGADWVANTSIVGVVSNFAALRNLVGGTFLQVNMQGYYTPGDGGGTNYYWSSSPCSLNAGAGDNGYQVAPLGGGGCWTADFKVPNILNWGIRGNNTDDIGPGVQAAYNANVGCIRIPAGIYLWNTGVTMTAQVPCFYGDGFNEAAGTANSTGGIVTASLTGTWIHRSSTGFAPVTITAVTGQGGTPGFSEMGFYEDQPAITSSAWTPTTYPYFFTLINSLGRIDFSDLNFLNISQCISVSNAARLHISRIIGQPVGVCLNFDKQFDITFLDDIDFWPFWATSGNAQTWTVGYQEANVSPIQFARSDSPLIGKIFEFGYLSGIIFKSSADGVTTGAQINSIQVDASKYAIRITGNNTQLQISNLRGAGGTLTAAILAGSETYRDESNSSVISIANLQCFVAGSSCVELTGGTPGQVIIGNALLWNFNNDNNTSVGLKTAAGGSIVLANTPSVVNPQNGGTIVPASTSGAFYMVPGVAQSWTPTVAGTGTAGSASYTTQKGTFWDSGAQLTVTFNIVVSGSLSGATGNYVIMGLPRTKTGLTGQDGACNIISHSGVVLDTSYTVMSGIIAGGAGVNQIQLLESGGGVPTQPTPVSLFGSGVVLEGTCTYRWNN